MHGSPTVKRAAAERRLTDLAERRRVLLTTRRTWKNRVAIREELAEIALTIDWLLDNLHGQR